MDAEKNNSRYRLYKHLRGNKSVFIRECDAAAVELFRRQHNNTDLMVSTCLYDGPETSSQKTLDLRFHLSSVDSERTRTSALEACYYISENCNIPDDSSEIIVHSSRKGDIEGPAAVQIIILIPPIVFGSFSTPLMSAINYRLARQMVEDSVDNIDIDVYWRDYCIPLTNSLCNGKYVTPITFKELLNLDSTAIEQLSRQPRPENSMIVPRRIPEAVEWFAKIHEQVEKEHKYQQKILELMSQDGWHIPDCVRRLPWIELGQENGLEACRITARFYSAIKASKDEIWHQIQHWARRNAYKDYPRLKAIVTSAIDNPCLCDCQHPLLEQFCPAGKCFMAELIAEYENPHLFDNK